VEPGYYNRAIQRHRLGYLLATRAYQKARLVISPTLVVKHDLLSHVKGINPERIRVIPNCVDTEFYRPDGMGEKVREKYSLQDKFVILYFGKIKRTKGVETLCKAFQILKKKVDAALIIGGAATATDRFLNYLKSTYKDVIFTGFVDDPRKYYAAADVFSIYTPGFHGGETFAISLAEAMSMGLPIVCSENPIFREVTRGNAVFGRPESPESLAECLLGLARDPARGAEMGRKNRRLAQSAYDSRVVGDNIEEAYREVLQ
jgi:glycosyltransferase involved in cell wall biosynthesis